MKKNIILLLSLTILYFVSIQFARKDTKNFDFNSTVKTEQTEAIINNYFIYGQYLNISGILPIETDLVSDVNLIIHGDTDYKYDLIYDLSNGIIFTTSELINSGIYLDNFQDGNYYIYLEVIYNGSNLYYSLKNNTTHTELSYYTLSINDIVQEVELDFIGDFEINVNTIDKPDFVYDIVIDAGHGGIDIGGISNSIYEKDANLDYARALKTRLETLGLKVKLTRDTDDFEDGIFKTYGEDGRIAIIYESYAKYNLSIHCNSWIYDTTANGFEIYTPSNIDYSFAIDIADNIVSNTGINYSSNRDYYNIYDGVYNKIIDDNIIKIMQSEAFADDYEPYVIKDNTPYYYIIRETGAIATNAYVDGRADEGAPNIYKDTNRGIESYLIELGYLTNENDIYYILNKQDEYISSIEAALKKLLKI